ncbi:MAG: flavin reductase [Clostridia bacterium]|nr:flavin reductase [Clostridia bacterium]
MQISKNIKYVGVFDSDLDLFEGQYKVPNGISYNSYVILDEKIAVTDTVDARFTNEWLNNIRSVLGGRKPDYLIIHHMEPDHSANIQNFINTYPNAAIVSSAKAFKMMEQYFGSDFKFKSIMVTNGDSLNLGETTLTFYAAPMVHWPEVMVSYDENNNILFSADAFGKFGSAATNKHWEDEAARYYFGIVGKYGAQVQSLLKKLGGLKINKICPLHGPVLSENIEYYVNLYNNWSSYTPCTDGVLIAYTSVYGNTKKAVLQLAELLKSGGCQNVKICDLARTDIYEVVSLAFRFNKLVLATTTYNNGIFPFMREFLNHLSERDFQNKTVALIENGSWAPTANKTMATMLEKCKNINFCQNNVTILSALNSQSFKELEDLASELTKDYSQKESTDFSALFNIGYGLYVVTCKTEEQHNGLIVNTVSQLTNSPNRVAVTINKDSYSHHIIKQTGKMNVNCLNTQTPFEIFETFGFKSGRTTNKFQEITPAYSSNGLAVLPDYINSYLSLETEQYIDLGTHGMFICRITEAKILNETESITYAYYTQNVKPQPETKNKKGFVCKICGFVYEGDTLPADYICPICKHGAQDFEEIK